MESQGRSANFVEYFEALRISLEQQRKHTEFFLSIENKLQQHKIAQVNILNTRELFGTQGGLIIFQKYFVKLTKLQFSFSQAHNKIIGFLCGSKASLMLKKIFWIFCVIPKISIEIKNYSSIRVQTDMICFFGF